MSTKVCILTTVHQPFDVRIFHKEAKSLAKAGYDVTLIAQHAENEVVGGINIIALPKPKNRFVRIFGLSWKTLILALRQKYDIYHFHDPELIFIGIILKILGKKVIYDVHEDYPDYILEKMYLPHWIKFPFSKIMKFVEWLTGKALDYIITADSGVYKRFPCKKAEIIYNYPDLSTFRRKEKEEAKLYDLIYPGTVSNYILNSIIDVTIEVLKTKLDFKVLLISSNTMIGNKSLKRIAEQIKKRGITENTIKLMGHIPHDEVCSYIKQSRIGFIPLPNTPKFQKNIPTKLFEFMFCKIPVVASDLFPTRQFVENNYCCELVDINDRIDTSKIILELLKDDGKRNTMGNNGHNLVSKFYNWGNEEKKLFSIYKGLLVG